MSKKDERIKSLEEELKQSYDLELETCRRNNQLLPELHELQNRIIRLELELEAKNIPVVTNAYIEIAKATEPLKDKALSIVDRVKREMRTTYGR